MTFLADSGVWIDLLADRETRHTIALQELIDRRERVIAGDLVLAEVLQGTRDDRDFARAAQRLSLFDQIAICDPDSAVVAARNDQALRRRGITVRKTIDTLIATRCILDGVPLLYTDRDFDPFVAHLGLRSALDYLRET